MLIGAYAGSSDDLSEKFRKMNKLLKDWAFTARNHTQGNDCADNMNAADELIPTRASLLERLKDLNDQEGWKAFFDTYWRLIYKAGRRAGLNDAEAQDAVQDTLMCVCKSMPTFEYDKGGSFKAWLLQLTTWRVVDQIRKRMRQLELQDEQSRGSRKTDTVGKIPDPAAPLEAAWDQEWEDNIIHVALERVKRKVDGKQYQIFALHLMKGWPVARISRALKINPGRVYLAKHRVSKLIQKEVMSLRKQTL